MKIVVKVGTLSVADNTGSDRQKIRTLIGDIARLMKKGHKVILISSGAVGAGLPIVHMRGPFQKKTAAAVGQPLLINDYVEEAKRHKMVVGQMLALSDDLSNKRKFKNFMLHIEGMLSHKVLPIINENNIMETKDLEALGNDMLGAKVAVGLKAHKYIILTNKKGLYTSNPDRDPNAKLIKEVKKIDRELKKRCAGTSGMGIGGMLSKIKSVEYALAGGVETLIGLGGVHGTLTSALKRNFTGTKFLAKKIK